MFCIFLTSTSTIPIPPNSLSTLHHLIPSSSQTVAHGFCLTLVLNIVRGQKIKMTQHLGSAFSFNIILKLHFNLKDIKDTVAAIVFPRGRIRIHYTYFHGARLLDYASLHKSQYTFPCVLYFSGSGSSYSYNVWEWFHLHCLYSC